MYPVTRSEYVFFYFHRQPKTPTEQAMSELLDSSAAVSAATRATFEATQNADHPPSGGGPDFDFFGVVFLTDYYTVAPQAWFRKINSTFASHSPSRNSTGPCSSNTCITDGHHSPLDTLCDNPAAVANSYCELQNILLQSYTASAPPKRPPAMLDHPCSLGSRKPSILMDQVIILKAVLWKPWAIRIRI
jgi:hypothetical protein